MGLRQDRRSGGKERRAGKKGERGKEEEGERRDGGAEGRKAEWMEGQRSREGRGGRQSHLQGEAEKRDLGPEPRRGKEATLLRAG